MIALSLVAIVYIGFVALVQPDMKKLIAYSSISHMGFATLGVFIAFTLLETPDGRTAAILGLEGALVQLVSHGFISGALFLCVGVMYDRLHSRRIADYGGVANTMPIFASFMMLFALANSGLPGTSGFVGEFLVILGSFQANVWIAFLAGLTLILGAAYTLWMYKRVVFGEVRERRGRRAARREPARGDRARGARGGGAAGGALARPAAGGDGAVGGAPAGPRVEDEAVTGGRAAAPDGAGRGGAA